MKALRLHTIKKITVLLLVIGFLLPFVQPAEAMQAHPFFVSWLQTMVKKTRNPLLKHKLRRLSRSRQTVDHLIKQISQIIEQNRGQLNFPVTSAGTAQDMYRLLLLEWSRYQSGNAMAAVPAIPIVKPVAAVNAQSKSSPGAAPAVAATAKKYSTVYSRGLRLQRFSFIFSSLQPLSSGIAIGAP